MYSGGRVTAVVDWELAHLGDPMDDIAWLSLRATQEPFTDFPTRLREYEVLSGNRIDEARVHYYQVMAETKLQVMSHRPAPTGDGDTARVKTTVAGATSGTASSMACCTGDCGSKRWGGVGPGGTRRADEAGGAPGERSRLDVRRRPAPTA